MDDKREKLQNKNGNDLFRKPIYIEGKKNDVELECSLKWNAGYSEDIFPYTNNIYQKDGGTHLLGFRSALTRIINKYAAEKNIAKKNKEEAKVVSGDTKGFITPSNTNAYRKKGRRGGKRARRRNVVRN